MTEDILTELDAEDFDITAWIGDGKTGRPAHSVTVYRDLSLMADVEKIQAELRRLDALDANEAGYVGDDSVGEAKPVNTERQQLEATAEALLEKMRGAKATFTVRGLIQPEQNRIIKAVEERFKDKPGYDLDSEKQYAILAEAVEPRLTPKQWRALHEVIGQAQFQKILTTYARAQGVVPDVDAPFSPGS